MTNANLGRIVRTPKGLGIQGPPNYYGTGKGVIVAFDMNSAREYYEDPALVTEFTPKVCKELMTVLPRTVFAARSYSSGQTGTDPEVFAFTEAGKLIPAYTFLPKGGPKGITVYWDGFQAEFQVTPTHCHSYLSDYVRTQLLALYSKLKAHDPKARLEAHDVVRLDRTTMATAAEEHIMLGCAPSLNAYPRTKPIDILEPREHPYRYSGTHLHYSVSDVVKPDWFPHGTVVMMDKIVGLLLTALGRDWEDPRRRKAYGRAGEHRIPAQTNCRLEYRTPGAFLLHHPAIFNFACDIGRSAYRLGLTMDGRLMTELADSHKIINACDADAAWRVVDSQRQFFTDLFENIGSYYKYNAARTMDVLRTGAKASGMFGTDLAENWMLTPALRAGWKGHNENPGTNWSRLVV